MTQVSTPAATVSRRHWIALAVATLAGCGGSSGTSSDATTTGSGASGGSEGSAGAGSDGQGGGGGATQTAGAPGTGGTGISVLGPISGFGSVIINGVHYDESGARITIDGAWGQQRCPASGHGGGHQRHPFFRRPDRRGAGD
jgi:hypothetical protein